MKRIVKQRPFGSLVETQRLAVGVTTHSLKVSHLWCEASPGAETSQRNLTRGRNWQTKCKFRISQGLKADWRDAESILLKVQMIWVAMSSAGYDYLSFLESRL